MGWDYRPNLVTQVGSPVAMPLRLLPDLSARRCLHQDQKGASAGHQRLGGAESGSLMSYGASASSGLLRRSLVYGDRLPAIRAGEDDHAPAVPLVDKPLTPAPRHAGSHARARSRHRAPAEVKASVDIKLLNGAFRVIARRSCPLPRHSGIFWSHFAGVHLVRAGLAWATLDAARALPREDG
jgi:hypothetical protein